MYSADCSFARAARLYRSGHSGLQASALLRVSACNRYIAHYKCNICLKFLPLLILEVKLAQFNRLQELTVFADANDIKVSPSRA